MKTFTTRWAVHALLHKSGDVRQVKLLPDEIFPAVAADEPGHGDHEKDHQHGQDCEDRAQHQHGDEGDYDHQRGHQHLGDGLVDHLPQGVRIVLCKGS